MAKRMRTCQQGNALIEYGVPMAIILIATGVLATSGQIQGLMADYFMASSGHTNADLSGSVFTTRQVGSFVPGGEIGNGWEAFNDYARVLDGSGSNIGQSAGGIFFAEPITRAGARAASSSPEYLYP